MIKSFSARIGVATLAVTLALAGLATPAWAATTGAIAGRFVSATGSPLAATVDLYDPDGAYIDGTETDADGRYQFATVVAGEYKLEFNAHGLRQWARQKTDLDSADVITVVAGEVTTVDETQFPVGSVIGRLVDATGHPAPWATVAVARVGTPESEWIRNYTDDDGRYRIEVTPGRYQVQFVLASGAQQWVPQRRLRAEAAVFDVEVGVDTVVDDTLLPTGWISGRVLNSSGQPVTDIQVTARAGDIVGGYGNTDEDGRYLIDAVFPGRYKLAFELPNYVTVWAHGALSEAAAEAFSVTAGAETVVDETLLTGSIAGRFTGVDGAGIGGAQVTVTLGVENYDVYLTTDTDSSGAYRIDDIPAADEYVVSFDDWASNRRQYAFGKTTGAEADKITVVAGKTTTVDDTRLAGGELRIRPTDRATGAPVADFCVYLFGPTDESGCTEGSELVLADVGPGTYEGSLTPGEGSLYLRGRFAVTVTSGAATAVAVPLTQGGAITTVVTDSATGQPVANVCLMARTMTSGVLGEGGGECTNSQGQIRVGPVVPGAYTLFARAPYRSPYGHQWVGAAGGTGSQPDAAKIMVRTGEITTGPAVRMDRAGTITGVVTVAATGLPVSRGYLAYSGWGFGAGPSHGVGIAADGRYTLTGLGPYDWPLYVANTGTAPQWSGGVGNRFKASKISVRSGETTTYSPALVTGTLLTGTVTPADGAFVGARLMAYNAMTGDPIGVAGARPDGTYQMPIVGPQSIKISYEWSTPDGGYNDGWYDGATGFADAERVHIPCTGAQTLDLILR